VIYIDDVDKLMLMLAIDDVEKALSAGTKDQH
jgi:hypothetical protein